MEAFSWGDGAGKVGEVDEGLVGEAIAGAGLVGLVAVEDGVVLGDVELVDGVGEALGFGDDGALVLKDADKFGVGGVL